jgi:hypothetical protein
VNDTIELGGRSMGMSPVFAPRKTFATQSAAPAELISHVVGNVMKT